MPQETSEQLDEKLRQEGYTPTVTDPNKYERVNDRGGVDRVWGRWRLGLGKWISKKAYLTVSIKHRKP